MPEPTISGTRQALHSSLRTGQDGVWRVIAPVLLAVSIFVWLVPIGSPLFLDETGSYWQIKDGLSSIWSHASLAFPGYFYVLGVWSKVFGTSEIALRALSVVAMLGAVYLLYLVARELFDRATALFAVIVFCLDPIIIYGSVDARPYAIAALVANAAILVVLRLRKATTNWAAAASGAIAALPLYFHTLFGTLLPALALCFFLVMRSDRRLMWKRAAIAFSVFVLTFLPLVPRLLYLFRTRRTLVIMGSPRVKHLFTTLSLGSLGVVSVVVLAISLHWSLAHWPRLRVYRPIEVWKIGVCCALALVPLLLLFGVSASTPLHVFEPRYRMPAVPGIALCWALVASLCLPQRWITGLAIILVAFSAGHVLTRPMATQHGTYTWKYALNYAERNASRDNAPMVICSGFAESDYVAMPTRDVQEARYFSPLAYYPVTVPVVPLPKLMNRETVQLGTTFLRRASAHHQEFLALAVRDSWPTLRWLAQQASTNYTVRKLGVFSWVEVLEFEPRVHPS